MPAYLAGRVRILGHHAGYVVAASSLSGRQVLVALVCVAVLFGLLWLPVLGDRLTDLLSKKAPKVAPRIFFLGLGILVTGLVIHVRILDVVGACLIGALVLGAILDNY